MRERPRLLILATVLSGHAIAIYLMALRFEVQRDSRNVELLSIPIHLTPIQTPEGREQPEGDVVEYMPREATHPADWRPIDVPAPAQATAITLPSLEPLSGERIDWAAQAEQMARKWSEPDPRPMNFGASGQEDEPAEAPAPNFFKSNSPRRAGYSEMLAPGVERIWTSSRCYREFGIPPDRVAGTRPDLNPLTCLGGSGPVRDDLFDHLKPDYLKAQE